jgi:MarR family transcriptional regulator, multiple antibiotic resistance protein MarR
MSGHTDLFLDLWRAAHRAERLVAHELEAAGVDGSQLATVALLARLGSATTTALADELGVPFMTMSDVLERLAKRRDVVRTPNPEDRRSSLWALTPTGRERHRASEAPLRRALRALEKHAEQPLSELHDGVNMLNDAMRSAEESA